MATRQYVIYVCDRCGHETEHHDDRRNSECGTCEVRWKGHRGAIAYDGAWGGCGISGEAWLCLDCTKEFTEFMNKKVSNDDNGDIQANIQRDVDAEKEG